MVLLGEAGAEEFLELFVVRKALEAVHEVLGESVGFEGLDDLLEDHLGDSRGGVSFEEVCAQVEVGGETVGQ